MKVQFRANWFGPDSIRRRKGETHELPDEWSSIMPPRTTFIEKPSEVPVANQPAEEKKAPESDVRESKVRAFVKAKPSTVDL